MTGYRAKPASRQEKLGRLFMAAVLVVFLPYLPFGNLVLYPFTILTTWFHEMGHGLTALLVGMDFERLVIFPDGSGYAESRFFVDSSRASHALVAAGGPIGPSVASALLILASGRRKYWRFALLALAGALMLSVLIWVRSATGLVVLPLLAASYGWVAWRGPDWLERFALQFTGVLGAMSMLTDLDYLFSESAVIGGQSMPSDTGTIEAALLLPH